MRTTILLDLDGPLGDCVGDVFERFGVPRDEQRTRCTTYDGLTEFLAEQHAATPNADPWRTLGNDADFWRYMTEQPWAQRLLAHCQRLAPTVVCTKPLAYGACASGKLDWCLDRKLPCTIVRVPGEDKGALASPWHLLIDDAEHQVEAFRDAGGRAYLWPMPWNEKGPAFDYGIDRALYEIEELVDAHCSFCEAHPDRCERLGLPKDCPG